MTPKIELFRIVGMDDVGEVEKHVLDAIENLGYTIVHPQGTTDILCCMTPEEIEKCYLC